MVPQWRALAAIPENLHLISSTVHMVAHNHLELQFQEIWLTSEGTNLCKIKKKSTFVIKVVYIGFSEVDFNIWEALHWNSSELYIDKPYNLGFQLFCAFKQK